MSTSGTKDIQQIRRAASAACAGKGIPEYIQNPNLPGTTIQNPLFANCVNDEIEKKSKGLLKAVSFIENRGGLKAVINEFYDIRSQVKGKTSTSADLSNTGSSSSAGFWIMIFVFLILLIAFLVIYFKKPKLT